MSATNPDWQAIDAALLDLEKARVNYNHCRDLLTQELLSAAPKGELPSDSIQNRIRDWQTAGAKLVWVIDPDPKIVFCHAPTGVVIRRESDTHTGDPVLPGFAVPVADLFRLPTATPG